LLVGAFDAFDEEVAQGAGATANITKPFEPAALIELVKSLVSAEARTEPQPEPGREMESPKEPVTADVNSATPVEEKAEDLLGLETIFKAEPEEEKISSAFSDEDIDRIADRVIQRLSSAVVESIAWDIVPDITEKIVREELKRIDES
jgi:DNA-binding response OmpR family regulator